MKKFMEEFKAFALRGNVMDMAVGVIIGGAFSGIVTSLTDNFINPILNVLTGGATYTLQDVSGFASSFIASVVNFIIMAFILFCLLKAVNKVTSLGAKKDEPAAPTTKKCPFCMSEIDIKATRCPHCTSQLPEEFKQLLRMEILYFPSSFLYLYIPASITKQHALQFQLHHRATRPPTPGESAKLTKFPTSTTTRCPSKKPKGCPEGTRLCGPFGVFF